MKITDIPAMGAHEIGEHLRFYAEAVSPGTLIVELGVWLGAGTAYLAEGARVSGSHVHAYDKFDARRSEQRKAKACGWTIKGDTLPLVQKSINALGLGDYVTLHKGPICSEPWTHGKIGLFVLDTCKGADPFMKVIRQYAPHFVAGSTIVVLMDYGYSVDHGKEIHMNQPRWVEQHRYAFRDIDTEMADGSSASFLYLGGDLCS